VRVLQRKLYRAAKVAPQRQFGVMYDKVYRRDVLEEAWQRVRRNRGSAGVDKQTVVAVEAYGVDRVLDELEAELREKRYRNRSGGCTSRSRGSQGSSEVLAYRR
jgi:RNA-directed DNA polymerase